MAAGSLVGVFGSIGGPEVILLFILALLIFGPRKLPELGRNIGKAMADFRRATNDFKMNLEREVQVDAVKDAIEAGRKRRHALPAAPSPTLAATVAAPSPQHSGPSQPSSETKAADTASPAGDGVVNDGGTDSRPLNGRWDS